MSNSKRSSKPNIYEQGRENIIKEREFGIR